MRVAEKTGYFWYFCVSFLNLFESQGCVSVEKLCNGYVKHSWISLKAHRTDSGHIYVIDSSSIVKLFVNFESNFRTRRRTNSSEISINFRSEITTLFAIDSRRKEQVFFRFFIDFVFGFQKLHNTKPTDIDMQSRQHSITNRLRNLGVFNQILSNFSIQRHWWYRISQPFSKSIQTIESTTPISKHLPSKLTKRRKKRWPKKFTIDPNFTLIDDLINFFHARRCRLVETIFNCIIKFHFVLRSPIEFASNAISRFSP